MADDFRELIMAKLKEMGLSQRAASLQAGLSSGTLYYILNSRTAEPEEKTLQALAKLLGIDLNHFRMLAKTRASPWEIKSLDPILEEALLKASELPPESQRLLAAVINFWCLNSVKMSNRQN